MTVYVAGDVVCLGDLMIDHIAQLSGPLAIGSDSPAPIVTIGGGSAVGSSRVDLQACKLEYSIVSPK